MKAKARVAIVGFGRTGRQAFRAIWLHYRDRLEPAAIGIHDPANAAAAAHLLKYDSNYGRFAPRVSVADGRLEVDDLAIPVVSADRPEALPWRALRVDVVIDATGAFSTSWRAAGHLQAGAAKVIVTAPSDDADLTMIYGVNERAYDSGRHHVISTESGTANALAVVLTALADRFPIESALLTAVRAYDSSQKLLDSTDNDLRRARSAPASIVPTSTRAAQAMAAVIPSLAGRIGGYAVHVPVSTVSMLELTAHLGAAVGAADVNEAFRAAAAGPLGEVLGVADAPLVSSDYVGDGRSAVIDAPVTVTIGPLAKVGAWFDNEWGYSRRVADVASLLAASMP